VSNNSLTYNFEKLKDYNGRWLKDAKQRVLNKLKKQDKSKNVEAVENVVIDEESAHPIRDELHCFNALYDSGVSNSGSPSPKIPWLSWNMMRFPCSYFSMRNV
jgi:hypothetical protein